LDCLQRSELTQAPVEHIRPTLDARFGNRIKRFFTDNRVLIRGSRAGATRAPS
jgi:hypothetical protein